MKKRIFIIVSLFSCLLIIAAHQQGINLDNSTKGSISNPLRLGSGIIQRRHMDSDVLYTTFTYHFVSGGDVFLATNTFIPISGMFDSVDKSTFGVFEIQAFTIFPSTIGSTMFRLAKTTSTNVGTPFTLLSSTAEVTANNKYSNWVSTSFYLYPNDVFSVHITSVQSGPGLQASEYGFKFRYWKLQN